MFMFICQDSCEAMTRDENRRTDSSLDVIRALSRAIETIKAGRHDPIKAHERVKGMYAWSDIAQRTEVVYQRAMESDRKDTFERLTRYVPSWGPVLLLLLLHVLLLLLLLLLLQSLR